MSRDGWAVVMAGAMVSAAVLVTAPTVLPAEVLATRLGHWMGVLVPPIAVVMVLLALGRLIRAGVAWWKRARRG